MGGEKSKYDESARILRDEIVIFGPQLVVSDRQPGQAVKSARPRLSRLRTVEKAGDLQPARRDVTSRTTSLLPGSGSWRRTNRGPREISGVLVSLIISWMGGRARWRAGCGKFALGRVMHSDICRHAPSEVIECRVYSSRETTRAKFLGWAGPCRGSISQCRRSQYKYS